MDRTQMWASLLPDTITIDGKDLDLRPDNESLNDSSLNYPNAKGFVYLNHAYFDDTLLPGLYVSVGLRDGDEPTRETADAYLSDAIVFLEKYVIDRKAKLSSANIGNPR